MPVKGKHLLHLVPHGINSDEFKSLDNKHQSVVKLKKEYFKDKEYNFVVGFNSRNAHRKHPQATALHGSRRCLHRVSRPCV